MEILHVSAECYPIAKAGGLGDVVGALPKYQNKLGHIAKVIMPMYRTKFLYQNEWELVHEGGQYLGSHWFHYSVIKEKNNKLGYDLFLIDINGLLDRENIYGYSDDSERFISFQIAFCDWINSWEHRPDIVHCHDHHTGFIPFMFKFCYDFRTNLSYVPTVFTIHNGEYQGWLPWDKYYFLPNYDGIKWGLLDWANTINPMASALKCASKITTVSNSYMGELRYSSKGLEPLFEYEKGKCTGILNGVDFEVWNPETDQYLDDKYNIESVAKGKQKNKEKLAAQFGLRADKPLFTFIGRLVHEKAADLLPEAIRQCIYAFKNKANYLILGSGAASIETELLHLNDVFQGIYSAYIGYHEGLSHQIYAGADFLLMPSRVEPCGLNQMYALRYGTIPIVRNIGGLHDTVIDYGEEGGFGLRFDQATVGDIVLSVGRGIELYYDKKPQMGKIVKNIMQIDHSWDGSAQQYIDLYESLNK